MDQGTAANMGRVSDKHGPRIDDAMKEDLAPAERVSDSSHASGHRDPEEALTPDETPFSLESAGSRSLLARTLHRTVFPGIGRDVIEDASRNGAPPALMRALRGLPADSEFENVQQVWLALGGAPIDEV
jgi:hypothetical protein